MGLNSLVITCSFTGWELRVGQVSLVVEHGCCDTVIGVDGGEGGLMDG